MKRLLSILLLLPASCFAASGISGGTTGGGGISGAGGGGGSTNGTDSDARASITLVSNRVHTISPVEFGAVGDAVDLYGATLSSGIVTAASSTFSAGDTNKWMIFFKDSTNATFVSARITNVMSSTQVKLATNLTVSGSREATYGTDNRASWQAALDWLGANGGGTLEAPNGYYLFTTQVQQDDGNYCVLRMPYVDSASVSNPSITIHMKGAVRPVLYAHTATTNTAALTNSVGMPNAGTVCFFPVVPVSGVSNYFIYDYNRFVSFDGSSKGNNWNRWEFSDLTFRRAWKAKVFGVGLRYGGGHYIHEVCWDAKVARNNLRYTGEHIDPPSTLLEDPTGVSALITGGLFNFEGNVIENCMVNYWENGFWLGEHSLVHNCNFNVCGEGWVADASVTASGGISGIKFTKSFYFLCRKIGIVALTGDYQTIDLGFLGVETHGINGGAAAHVVDVGGDKSQITFDRIYADATPIIDTPHKYGVMQGTNGTDTFFVADTMYVTTLVGTATGNRATNEVGAVVNAIRYGLVADGVTDNSVALSNLLNGADAVYIPSGTYLHTNPIIINRSVNVFGDGKTSTLKYTGTNTAWALNFNVGGAHIKNLRFVSAVGGDTGGGTIKLNAIGYSTVSECSFENGAGDSIFSMGAGDLYDRTNHFMVSGCTFSNVFNAIHGGSNEMAEFAVITGNRGDLIRGAGIWLHDPNATVQGNSFCGYRGVAGTPVSYGFKVTVANQYRRGHCKIAGNIFAHHLYDGWFEGVHGYADSGTIIASGNTFGGGQSFVVTNCIMPVFIGNLIGPYQTNFFANTTNMMLLGNIMQSPWQIKNTTWSGVNNYSNAVAMVNIMAAPFSGGSFVGAEGIRSTNDTIANSSLAIVRDSSGYATFKDWGGTPVSVQVNQIGIGASAVDGKYSQSSVLKSNATYGIAPGANATATPDVTWGRTPDGVFFVYPSLVVSNRVITPRWQTISGTWPGLTNMLDMRTNRYTAILGTNASISGITNNAGTGTNETLVLTVKATGADRELFINIPSVNTNTIVLTNGGRSATIGVDCTQGFETNVIVRFN